MAKGIREIRRRIKSIRATRQITKAMQMVSAVKMRRAQEAALRTRSYVARVMQLLGEIAHRREQYQHPLLSQPSKEGRVLLVLISANRGLAGGLTTNLVRAVEKRLGGHLAGRDVDLVTVGKRGFDAFARSGKEIVADFSAIPDTATFHDIAPMTRFAEQAFSSGRYSTVCVGYMHFVSTLIQKPVVVQVAPLGEELVRLMRELHKDALAHPEASETPDEYLFEPSPQEVLNTLLPQIAELQLFQCVLEAQASEHSARMVAMKNATEAAGDIIDDLQFTANQLRQASITQELAEITTGANALAESA